MCTAWIAKKRPSAVDPTMMRMLFVCSAVAQAATPGDFSGASRSGHFFSFALDGATNRRQAENEDAIPGYASIGVVKRRPTSSRSVTGLRASMCASAVAAPKFRRTCLTRSRTSPVPTAVGDARPPGRAWLICAQAHLTIKHLNERVDLVLRVARIGLEPFIDFEVVLGLVGVQEVGDLHSSSRVGTAILNIHFHGHLHGVEAVAYMRKAFLLDLWGSLTS